MPRATHATDADVPQADVPLQSATRWHDEIASKVGNRDPVIFGPGGNRKRGYRCAQCILHKKGCRGDPPACDTCTKAGRASSCTFDQEEIQRAYLRQKERIAASGKSTKPKHPAILSKTGVLLPSNKTSRSVSSYPPGATSKKTFRGLEAEPYRRRRKRSNLTSSTFAEVTTDISSSENFEDHKTNKTTNRRRPSLTSLTPEPAPSVSREERDQQQKRHIHALCHEELRRIQHDPVVLAFVNQYGSPLSQNLLPMIEIICESLVERDPSMGEAATFITLMKRFNRIWDLARTFLPEVMRKNNHLHIKDKYRWACRTFPRPLNEYQVEEFFFALVCIKMNDWDENEEDKANLKVLRWYQHFVTPEKQWLRDGLYWHETTRLGWDVRRQWMEGWLRKKIEKYEIVTVEEIERRGNS